MVNVLVIGAAGNIGQALTSSLVRSGNHRVYGIVRTPAKAALLAIQEVIPIIGSIGPDDETHGKAVQDAIEKFDINVVVDVSGVASFEASYSLLPQLKEVGAKRLERGNSTQKLGFIFISGTWVHGSSHGPVNDLTPVGTPDAPTQPVRIVANRPAIEREILASSDVLDALTIRPALVYGRTSATWNTLFNPLKAAFESGASAVSIPADPDARPGIVHVDDVGSGIHAAIDWLPLVAGRGLYPVFDLVTSQESMRDILEAAGRELGFMGKVELAGVEEDIWAEALSTSFNGSSGRARGILGWVPRRIGFVQGMDVFARAWAAGV